MYAEVDHIHASTWCATTFDREELRRQRQRLRGPVQERSDVHRPGHRLPLRLPAAIHWTSTTARWIPVATEGNVQTELPASDAYVRWDSQATCARLVLNYLDINADKTHYFQNFHIEKGKKTFYSKTSHYFPLLFSFKKDKDWHYQLKVGKEINKLSDNLICFEVPTIWF